MNCVRALCLAASACVATVRAFAAPASTAELIRDDFDFAAAQYTRMVAQLDHKTGTPRSFEKGELKVVKYTDWISGFFPGALWYLYEQTGDAQWREAAAHESAFLEPEKDNRKTHDVGFVLYTSYGNGYRLTHDPHYRDVLLAGAESLSSRFNPKVGAIKSWDGRKQWPFPVIIDNMMNLELLLWASKISGNPKYHDIAIAHADTTLVNHFRPDGSSYHVVDYDPETGKVRSRVTHQGAADDSAWSRGQAWGLYGYTMMFRETQKPAYLAHARKIAGFLLHHPNMPADKVPYWDFNAPNIPQAPRDASAASIMASALLELATLVDADEAASYRAYAVEQLRSLSSPAYRAKLGDNGCFLLMHSTGNFPQGGEIDVPIAYADYYFLEALLRAKALK